MILERNISFDLIDKNTNSTILSLSYNKDSGSFLNIKDDKFSWILPTKPKWRDIVTFLESRVMSKRNNSNEELKLLGLSKWDIFKIISKTNGEMFGDNFKMVNLVGFD